MAMAISSMLSFSQRAGNDQRRQNGDAVDAHLLFKGVIINKADDFIIGVFTAEHFPQEGLAGIAGADNQKPAGGTPCFGKKLFVIETNEHTQGRQRHNRGKQIEHNHASMVRGHSSARRASVPSSGVPRSPQEAEESGQMFDNAADFEDIEEASEVFNILC
jgi:hypothetical protein